MSSRNTSRIPNSMAEMIDTAVAGGEADSALQGRVAAGSATLARLRSELGRVLLRQENLIEGLLTGILAGGHVLLEGLPGLGKTELVKGLARLASVDFKRVQF